jgi:hypothetical protein
MPGIVKQQSRQQLVGLVAHNGAVGPLGEGFMSDRLKQRRDPAYLSYLE